MNICVSGLGHLGLVTATGLAKLGHRVVGLDFDKELVLGLQNRKTPIFEQGLNDLIALQMKAGRLTFSYNAKEALGAAQVLWFAFDTPVNEKDVADIVFLEKNFKKIGPSLNDGMGIIFSSQAPIGFVSKIAKDFRKEYPGKKCFFACSPENLRLGKAVDDFLNPNRIIIGVDSSESKKFFSSLFSSISDRLEWMSIESAEMTKHAINAFLGMSVCFANELALICEQTGADSKEVERGLKTESRIGPKAYLKPGTAFSGGTLARDINFLIKLSNQNKLPAHLIRSINESNSYHKDWIERQCLRFLGSFKNKTVAILGLTYKSGTNTLHRSFALELAKTLHAKGASVRGYDPVIKSISKQFSKVIDLKTNVADAIDQTDVVIIMKECPSFLHLDRGLIHSMRSKIIIDPNGFCEKPADTIDLKYVAIGKKGMKNLEGRVAIITGASQGLGKEIAAEFVRQGASVVICARGKAKLNAVKKKLEKMALEGQKIHALVADISKEGDVKKLIKKALTEFKRVDILVNNAGIYGPMGSIEKMDSRQWVRAIEINLFGVFYCCKHIMAHMKKNNYGKIINLSGGGATAPLAFISAYAASKAGIVRFTENLATECQGYNIDVNAVAPGALNTRLLDEVLLAGPKAVGKDSYNRALKQKKDGGVPLKMGVDLCIFLGSLESDGISGRLISAKWDPWKSLKGRRKELMKSDIYTLRRIVPQDRGKKWDQG